MKEISVDGVVIAPNVLETIVTLAAKDVEGVAAIGASPAAGLMGVISSKPVAPGVEFDNNEAGKLVVGVHIDVVYGYVLPEVAARVRSVVAEALETQLNTTVGAVDVYIDGIRFE